MPPRTGHPSPLWAICAAASLPSAEKAVSNIQPMSPLLHFVQSNLFLRDVSWDDGRGVKLELGILRDHSHLSTWLLILPFCAFELSLEYYMLILHKESMYVPSLQMLKARLDGVQGNLIWWVATLPTEEGWKCVPSNPSHSVILWFYHSMIIQCHNPIFLRLIPRSS